MGKRIRPKVMILAILTVVVGVCGAVVLAQLTGCGTNPTTSQVTFRGAGR